MFFEMYEDKADEVAAIIKTAATDNAAATEEDTIREKVQALKRRNTMQKDQLIDIGALETKVNESDDFTKAEWAATIFRVFWNPSFRLCLCNVYTVAK